MVSGRNFLYLLIAVFGCSLLVKADGGDVLFYKLQENYSVARLPDAALCFEEPFYPDCSKNIHIAPIAGKALYSNLDNELYSYYLAMNGTGMAVYKQSGGYSRFVAVVGLNEKCSDSARVRVEIWSDKSLIYQSGTVARVDRPLQINIEIPAECRKLKLVSAVQGDLSGGSVVWGNPGFVRRDIFPAAGETEIFIPEEFKGYLLKITDSAANETGCRICTAKGVNPIRLQFSTSANSDSYFVELKKSDDGSVKVSKPWQPETGLNLSCRIAVRDLDRAATYPGFMELWNTDSVLIGSSFVDNIHHGFPIDNLPAGIDLKGNREKVLGLYCYTGYFDVSQRDEYEFSTMSVWGSTIFIDDKFVVHWPEKHNFQPGRRCEFRGSVFLEAGRHKIEYMNYNKWPDQFTVCAWRRSSDVFRVMAGCDFIPAAKYKAVEVINSDKQSEQCSFEWEIADDCRIDMESAALTAVKFKVINSHNYDCEYRWNFGDNIVAVGDEVIHVFLTKGLFNVKLTAEINGQVKWTSVQIVDVNIDRKKVEYDPRNRKLFENVASPVFLSHYDVRSLAGFYEYAADSEEVSWQKAAAEMICAKDISQLNITENMRLLTDLSEYLCSIETAKYKSGLDLMEKVINYDQPDKGQMDDLRLLYIRMLLDYVGDNSKAKEQLEQVRGRLTVSRQVKRKVLQLEIDAGNDRIIAENSAYGHNDNLSDKVSRQLKVLSVIEHAKKCAEKSDRQEIQDGYNNLMELLNSDPELVLDNSFNLARLALLAGAGDYLQVYNIASRFQNASMHDIDESELLYYRALALIKLKKSEDAGKIYKIMSEKYPYHLKTAEIRTLLAR